MRGQYRAGPSPSSTFYFFLGCYSLRWPDPPKRFVSSLLSESLLSMLGPAGRSGRSDTPRDAGQCPARLPPSKFPPLLGPLSTIPHSDIGAALCASRADSD